MHEYYWIICYVTCVVCEACAFCMWFCFASCCLLCLTILHRLHLVCLVGMRLSCLRAVNVVAACDGGLHARRLICLRCSVPGDLKRNVKQSKSMRHQRKHGEYAGIVAVIQQITFPSFLHLCTGVLQLRVCRRLLLRDFVLMTWECWHDFQ